MTAVSLQNKRLQRCVTLFRRLLCQSEAATTVEYGLMAALIVITAISGFTAYGDELANLWTETGNRIATALGG